MVKDLHRQVKNMKGQTGQKKQTKFMFSTNCLSNKGNGLA